MRGDNLRLEVPDHHAFNELTLRTALLDVLVLGVLGQLITLLHAAGGDEEVVHTDPRHGGSLSVAVLKANATPHYTESAP